ncbi:MAG: dipeptide epimerase, partial [Gemmataceae bacterium]|nr:dipeptide epimerase [Gemmataceae bacterium]
MVELTALHVHIPLRKRVQHASCTRNATDNLIVRCRLDDGTVGYGEGVPREYVTGESIDLALDLLRRSQLAEQLRPCRDFTAAVRLAEGLRLEPVPGDRRGCRGNAARCALELALLDAWGQRFGRPLSAVTALVAPELYRPRNSVRYSGAITSANGAFKIRFSALRQRVYGFCHLKVKIGIPGQDDVRRLR